MTSSDRIHRIQSNFTGEPVPQRQLTPVGGGESSLSRFRKMAEALEFAHALQARVLAELEKEYARAEEALLGLEAPESLDVVPMYERTLEGMNGHREALLGLYEYGQEEDPELLEQCLGLAVEADGCLAEIIGTVEAVQSEYPLVA